MATKQNKYEKPGRNTFKSCKNLKSHYVYKESGRFEISLWHILFSNIVNYIDILISLSFKHHVFPSAA